MPDENKELSKELEQKRKEIAELKEILGEANSKKEELFKKREELGDSIRKSIADIRKRRKTRNSFTSDVKILKEDKIRIISMIKSLIEKLKSLQAKKKEYLKKHNIKSDPTNVKKQIQALETKIETEVMSFDKEQKLMKKIKELRSEANRFGEITKIQEEIDHYASFLDDLKIAEKDVKKDIRVKAKESQKEHEQILEMSKKIDELKKEEEETKEKFASAKQRFNDINKQIKDKLSDIGKLRGVEAEERTKKKKERKEKEKKTIAEKKKAVSKKMERGEKLTTEDLLLFQKEAGKREA